MIDKISISKAEIIDLPQILSLQKLAFQSEAVLYNNYNIDPLTQTIESIIADFNSYTFLKAVFDNKIVGSIKARAEEHHCWIGRLMVSPDFRRKGIGRRLLIEAENIFPNIDFCYLFTGNRSIDNMRLYQSVGYEVFEEYADENTPELTLVRMVKKIQ